MAVIGIDLGTTNSLGCVYRNGKAELIPNAYGSYLTPSVVSMTEDGKLIVGQPAKDRLITHPERTVSSFKKDMGTGRSWKPGEKSFLPEELSSLVIRSIVEDAQNYLGEEIEEAVISVPAYFHDEQRVAVKRAGALAGTVERSSMSQVQRHWHLILQQMKNRICWCLILVEERWMCHWWIALIQW